MRNYYSYWIINFFTWDGVSTDVREGLQDMYLGGARSDSEARTPGQPKHKNMATRKAFRSIRVPFLKEGRANALMTPRRVTVTGHATFQRWQVLTKQWQSFIRAA